MRSLCGATSRRTTCKTRKRRRTSCQTRRCTCVLSPSASWRFASSSCAHVLSFFRSQRVLPFTRIKCVLARLVFLALALRVLTYRPRLAARLPWPSTSGEQTRTILAVASGPLSWAGPLCRDAGLCSRGPCLSRPFPRPPASNLAPPAPTSSSSTPSSTRTSFLLPPTTKPPEPSPPTRTPRTASPRSRARRWPTRRACADRGGGSARRRSTRRTKRAISLQERGWVRGA